MKEGGLIFFKFSDQDKITSIANYDYSISIRSKLFQLWFRTIKGFDVIENNPCINKLRELTDQISVTSSKISNRNFQPYAVVLRRNADAVEVDTLSLEPTVKNLNTCEPITEWSPSYIWETSPYSQSLLSKYKTDR